MTRDGAFAAIRRERAGAVTMLPSALHAQNFRQIAELALKGQAADDLLTTSKDTRAGREADDLVTT